MRDSLEDLLNSAEAASEVETQHVDVDVREVRALLKTDFEFFIEFFLADSLDMDVPTFHGEIWSLLTDLEKERVLLAIPRDHAKTTLAKLVVIWYWLFTNHRFCVYLSNTATIAKGACKDIIGFLNHPNFQEVYGNVKILKSSENEGLWQFELPLPNGKVKTCILRAIGQGQQMRGINIDNQRPDIAIVDDVEDNENTESELQQKKLDRWMFGPFIKALARKKKILWLGNMLQKTSLLARLSRSPKWNPVVFGCLVKNQLTGQLEPLWPDKWSVAALKEDFKEYRDLGLIESWMCEMMNMPGHGENGFTLEMFNFAPIPTPDECVAAWISVDPAFGKEAHNDETCIAVHVLRESGPPMTVVANHGKFDEVEMFHQIVGLATYWNAWVWGIEAIAAQRVLITLFNMLLASQMLTGLVEIVPLMAGSGDPKVARIRAWVALMNNGEWAIPEGDVDISIQGTEYDPSKKNQSDDILDACAYGPMMVEQFLPLIMAQRTRQSFEELIQQGMEICNV